MSAKRSACLRIRLRTRAVPHVTGLSRLNALHIPNHMLPALREAGVTEGQIETMLVENPRSYFGG